MPEATVSIVVATHNRAQLLTRAIGSLRDQTIADFEIVIVDDHSSDNTPRVTRELEAEDPRIRAIGTGAHVGPGAARNLGVRHARGAFVAIMDDDDFALPTRLETQLACFGANPDAGLVFSSVTWVDRQGRRLNVFPGIVARGEFPSHAEAVFRLLYLQSNKIPNTSIMVRREIIQRVGYPEAPWIGEDWYWCMQMAAAGVRMVAIATPLVDQLRDNATPGLMSRKTEAFLAQREILRMIRSWLLAMNIESFDDLHRAAWSNQLAREARYWGGIRGLSLCVRAVAIAPRSDFARETFRWFCERMLTKAGVRPR